MSVFDKLIALIARRRTFFILIAPVAMLLFARPTVRGFVAGCALVVVGELVRLWASGYIVKSEELAVAGPFAFVRNPLYVGSLLIASGYCAMTGGWIVWAVVVPLFLIVHSAAVYTEERFLRGRFGSAFDDYCRRVPRWIPRPWGGSGSGKVSLQQILANNEHKNFACTLLVVAAFAVRLILGK